MCLEKVFGVVEMFDWVIVLVEMYFEYLDKVLIEFILGVVFKDWQDMCQVQDFLQEFWDKVGVQVKIG